MSGTFKITKRENMQASASSHLGKSEQRLRRQPFTKSTGMIGMPAINNVSRDEAIKRVETIRQQNNNELLAILEEEQRQEADREVKLREVTDDQERKRLERIFGIERAKASERIVNTSTQHEIELTNEMRRLGLM